MQKKQKLDGEGSEGEADQDLVVDDNNEQQQPAGLNGNHSPLHNGDGKKSPGSPGSESSLGSKKREDSGRVGVVAMN